MLVRPKFKQKRYRILLAVPLIILLSVIVVSVSLHSVRSVTDNADQLVSLQIPELRAIADLQSVLNRQLLMLHDYYATMELPDASIAKNLDEAFASNLETLVGADHDISDAELVNYIDKFKSAERNFHNEMQKGRSRDWDVLREHLAEATSYARQADTELGEWHRKVRERLAKGSSMTLDEVSRLNIIQISFNAVMLVIAGLLLMIIYFRMIDQEKLFHRAHFDSLTNLPNRRSLKLWSDELGKQENLSDSIYAMWLTLDSIGRISATYGHNQGDELIYKFSRALEKILEKFLLEIHLFSIGSSNWVMVIKDAEDDEALKDIINEIELLTRKPFKQGEREYNITCSIGVSHAEDSVNDIQTLIKNADTARTSVVNDGGNDHRFYHPLMTDEAMLRLSIENNLRRALEKDEFELHYQPKLSKNGDQVLSAEALIRWRSNGELIPPGVFIPVAEQTGLVTAIGDWVLKDACRQWVEWQQMGFDIPSVAVNISVQQFQSRLFVDTVKKVLTETGMPPHKLELEVTEEAASARPDQVVRVMDSLKKLGVSLAIDDFGTGYSSLAYLKRFPIDVIKIDRAFISQLEVSAQDRAIAKLIIEMSHQLSFKVVAEGVENEEQFQILKNMSCDLLQGFYFSKPLNKADYLEFLNR